MRAQEFITEANPRDPKTHPMLIKARLAHPNATSDLEALTLYFSDMSEKEIARLDVANRREDDHLDKLDQIDRRIQRELDIIDQRIDYLARKVEK